MSFHRHSPSLLMAVTAGLAAAFSGVASAGLGTLQSLYQARPMPESSDRRGRQRGKGGKAPRRLCGAAAIKRAARKRRNIRKHASKRGAR